MIDSPFNLDEMSPYEKWRDVKLLDYPKTARELLVELSDPLNLQADEQVKLIEKSRKTNMVIYQYSKGDFKNRAIPRFLGKCLGLERLDGNLCADNDNLSAIQVMPGGTRHEGYIPYTDRSINWHTDGYYNIAAERIYRGRYFDRVQGTGYRELILQEQTHAVA